MDRIMHYSIQEEKMLQSFCSETTARMRRIESHLGVIGMLHLENDVLKMYTVQDAIAYNLGSKLPIMNSAVRHAITELDILNELVAYRIETTKLEIIVVPCKEFSAVVIQHIKKSNFKGKSKKTYLINESNPIVDRIMDDDSVHGVVMTNDEGSPLLTNLTLITATNYGLALNRFGKLAQSYIKEIDIFDNVVAVRINTKKNEVMLCPDREFNIIVVQISKTKRKNIDLNQNKANNPNKK